MFGIGGSPLNHKTCLPDNPGRSHIEAFREPQARRHQTPGRQGDLPLILIDNNLFQPEGVRIDGSPPNPTPPIRLTPTAYFEDAGEPEPRRLVLQRGQAQGPAPIPH